ncbi:ankyrin repeat-containing domain protein [Annulohypoxylon moriforme]|nr:ankyrin repeat-containing domain protein [Annulohypoxylon moriforme]
MVKLRLVSKFFNVTILLVIRNQVDDSCDRRQNPLSLWWIPPPLKVNCFLKAIHAGRASEQAHYGVVAAVNRGLDLLTQPCEKRQREQHESIAEAVAGAYIDLNKWKDCSEGKMAKSLLSGAIIIGDLSLVKTFLESSAFEICNILKDIYEGEDHEMTRCQWPEDYLRGYGSRPRLEKLTDVNTYCPHFGHPLQLAAAWGHLHIVRYLLDSGADPRMYFLGGELRLPPGREYIAPHQERYIHHSSKGSALRAAVFGGHDDIVRMLLEPQHRFSISDDEYSKAIMAGLRGGYPHLCELLIRIDGRTLSDYAELEGKMFTYAVSFGQETAVRWLLNHGVDVNKPLRYSNSWGYSRSALGIAAQKREHRIVRLLLDCGANVHGTSREFERIAGLGFLKDQEIIKVLLEHGADPVMGLKAAVIHEHSYLVKWILSRYPNLLGQIWKDGRSVGIEMLSAVMRRWSPSPKMISLLVDAGVSLDDGYRYSEFPIIIAKKRNWRDIVELLLSLGARDREIVGDG